MLLSDHAISRSNERILMPRVDILSELERAYNAKEYSQKAPSWYYGDGQASWNTQVWIQFKDLDGGKCAALVDTDSDFLGSQLIITIVKQGYDD